MNIEINSSVQAILSQRKRRSYSALRISLVLISISLASLAIAESSVLFVILLSSGIFFLILFYHQYINLRRIPCPECAAVLQPALHFENGRHKCVLSCKKCGRIYYTGKEIVA